MKYFVFLFFLMHHVTYSQSEAESIYILFFDLKHPPKGENDIDWEKEKPLAEFTLNGKTPLKYTMVLQNDTIASLHRYENEQWILQEDMKYESYFLYRDENELVSHFRIEDFDKDGDEDLLCWIFSNMNGNEWTIVFLNDQENKKLVKLYDTADDTDIWDRPKYDVQTGIINCTLDGSVYSSSAESSYKLENLTAFPIEKHYQDRTSARYIEDFYYIGQNGKWKLQKKTKSKG